MVVSGWVKAFYHRGERPELYFWRSRGGIEVDLLVDRNNRLSPVEVKATATVLPGHTDSLNRWRELAGNQASEGVIVSMTREPFNLKGCRVLPWSAAMSVL
jgi:hypothetical protein